MGLRLMFIFSKAVETSSVYCQSKGGHDGTCAGPLLSPQPLVWIPVLKTLATPMLTWLIFKSSSRDMLWSKCRVCHREASFWHSLQDGGMGLKTGQVRTKPSQEHVLTCAGRLHLAPSLKPVPTRSLGSRASWPAPGEHLRALSSSTPTKDTVSGLGPTCISLRSLPCHPSGPAALRD